MSLEVKGLLARRGSFELRADFSLESGRILVLLGPSGCGKTTLLRSIAGLEFIEAGSILLDSARIDNLPPEKRRIGFVFQDLALFEQMSVRENIGYSLTIRREGKGTKREKTEQLAQRFRIKHLLDRFPAELSGGERQRVALARALAKEPALMLLDEPLSALDAPLRREMRRFMRIRLTESRLTAIHVTHDVDEAIDLADEIIIMHRGRIVGRGSFQKFAAQPGSGWLARFMNLGIVLPVRDVDIGVGTGKTMASAADGTRLRISAENIHTQDDSSAACIYVPFPAVQLTKREDTDARLTAKIIRSLPLSSTQGKIVLELVNAENYFFELPVDGLGTEMLLRAEGEHIELSVDERRCQLIPQEPHELPAHE